MDQSNAAPGLGIAGIMFTGIQTAGTVLPVGSGCTADAFHIKGVFFQPVSIDPVDQNPLPPILGEAKVQIPVSLPVGVRHDGEVSGREPGFPVNALGQAGPVFSYNQSGKDQDGGQKKQHKRTVDTGKRLPDVSFHIPTSPSPFMIKLFRGNEKKNFS